MFPSLSVSAGWVMLLLAFPVPGSPLIAAKGRAELLATR